MTDRSNSAPQQEFMPALTPGKGGYLKKTFNRAAQKPVLGAKNTVSGPFAPWEEVLLASSAQGDEMQEAWKALKKARCSQVGDAIEKNSYGTRRSYGNRGPQK